MKDLRPSPIAGAWYPGDPRALKQSIDRYLASAQTDALQGEVIGIIVPHAGHRYSGAVAANAFRCVRGLQPEVVCILSPLHEPRPGRLFTTGHDAYQTPLGAVPVDLQCLEHLEHQLPKGIELRRIRNDHEHAIEIELPFLQRIFPTIPSLLPIMMRTDSPAVVRGVAAAMANTLRSRSALLIASSDLSHFHTATAAKKLDQTVLQHIEALDPDGLLLAVEEGRGMACGSGALAATLWAARELGANQAKVLDYAHSGEITGDLSAVVGYAAVALLRTE